ncbi:uncharacterized protein LOC110009066 isoform X3 [Jatropha curcas]|uniref:uncharacterized protein LOC110009066 isoform X3 n=1 Tax=Jatropha curcas TaxID=180498 RepID=UPI0018930AFD|nr:uncharacterized protein LOC110009066 isoform X3 [Jatropha curcas]
MVHDLALFGRDEAGNDAYHGSHGFRRVRTLSADTCIKKKVIEIREQLKRIALQIGIVLKSCEKDFLAIRKAVTAGIFANACRLELLLAVKQYREQGICHGKKEADIINERRKKDYLKKIC